MNQSILLTIIETVTKTSPEAQNLVKNYVGANGKLEQIKTIAKVVNTYGQLKETYQNTPIATVIDTVLADKAVVDQINDFVKSAEQLDIKLTDEQIDAVYNKMMAVKKTAVQKIIGLLGARLNILGGLFNFLV